MSQSASLASQGPSRAAAPSGAESRETMRILLVDDEPNILKALMRVFRREGYEIHTANSGNEALDLLATEKFHLMCSDFRMPGIDGGELMKRAKARAPEMIRIMLTGHADTSSVMDAINQGAVYKFILKPWNDDDLRVTVALALRQYELVQKNDALQKINDRNVKEIDTLSKLAVSHRTQLASLLEKHGLLDRKQVDELRKLQLAMKEPAIRLLLGRKWVTESDVYNILRKHTKLQDVDLSEARVDATVAALVPSSFCKSQLVIPIRQVGPRLLLAMADPLDIGLTDDLRFCVGLEIQPVIAIASAIEAKVAEVYGDTASAVEDVSAMISGSDFYDKVEIVIDHDKEDVSVAELLRGTEEAPAIRLVNAIILEAMRIRASDIHIQPRPGSAAIRYRVDGVMVDKFHIPTKLALPVVSRIKIMAELDIAERRKPQDGRVTVRTPMRVIDLRISSLPTISGEKIVMRVLDRNGVIQKIGDLGFGADDQSKVLRVIQKPQGIILATGPTGGGKTTTLYSLLQHGATPIKNYVTIEDPVEYFLDMAGQVLVRESIGFGFATALRAILRQDPDVILLGEIRDLETAHAAFHAAMTGHLVFSTLHTNSATATIDRLLDLGVNRQIVASALEAVIAQRLVRKNCENCREPVTVDPDTLRALGPVFVDGIQQGFRGTGCDQCDQSGYKGRIGVYEVLVPNEEMKAVIASGGSTLEVDKLMRLQGANTLIMDAKTKVQSGVTTAEEVLRVLGPQVIVEAPAPA